MSALDAATLMELKGALASGPAALFALLSRLFVAVPGVRTATFHRGRAGPQRDTASAPRMPRASPSAMSTPSMTARGTAPC